MTYRNSIKYPWYVCINICVRNCSSARKCKICYVCTTPPRRPAACTYLYISTSLLFHLFDRHSKRRYLVLCSIKTKNITFVKNIVKKITTIANMPQQRHVFYIFYILSFTPHSIFTFLHYFRFFSYFSHLHISLPAVIFISELFPWQ